MFHKFSRSLVRIAVGVVIIFTLQLGGSQTAFAAGSGAIPSSALTVNGFAITGQILAKYQSVGAAVVGVPTDNQFATAPRTGLDGVWQPFTFGKIFFSADTGTHFVANGVLLDAYFNDCGFFCFGLPTSDIILRANGVQELQTQFGGNLYQIPTVSSTNDVRNLTDPILAKYVDMGETSSPLGLPVTDSMITTNGQGAIARFEWGDIAWSSATGPHEVHGAILWKWNLLGNANGRLGFPTDDEHSVAGGRQSDFQHGSIFWNSSTGKLKVITH